MREELHWLMRRPGKLRACELAIGVSSSRFEDVQRSIIEGADIVVGTTDGDPTTEGVGSGKPNTWAY